MKASDIKEYIYNHLLPPYIRFQDTYPDNSGKGILERFLDICTEYLGNTFSDIDNYLDLIDLDKTPDTFLNIFWEYFGYIPYAYTTLYNQGSPDPEDVNAALRIFPHADSRNILKYAIALYKIRGTQKFYNVLGRFYGVEFKVTPLYGGEGQEEDPLKDITDLIYTIQPRQVNKPIVISTYQDISSWYNSQSGIGCVKGGYYYGDCDSCVSLLAEVTIPGDIYTELQAQNRLEEVQDSFTKLINRYLPINAVIDNEEPDGNRVVLKNGNE